MENRWNCIIHQRAKAELDVFSAILIKFSAIPATVDSVSKNAWLPLDKVIKRFLCFIKWNNRRMVSLPSRDDSGPFLIREIRGNFRIKLYDWYSGKLCNSSTFFYFCVTYFSTWILLFLYHLRFRKICLFQFGNIYWLHFCFDRSILWIVFRTHNFLPPFPLTPISTFTF